MNIEELINIKKFIMSRLTMIYVTSLFTINVNG